MNVCRGPECRGCLGGWLARLRLEDLRLIVGGSARTGRRPFRDWLVLSLLLLLNWSCCLRHLECDEVGRFCGRYKDGGNAMRSKRGYERFAEELELRAFVK